jgi:hypothetical protein
MKAIHVKAFQASLPDISCFFLVENDAPAYELEDFKNKIKPEGFKCE